MNERIMSTLECGLDILETNSKDYLMRYEGRNKVRDDKETRIIEQVEEARSYLFSNFR